MCIYIYIYIYSRGSRQSAYPVFCSVVCVGLLECVTVICVRTECSVVARFKHFESQYCQNNLQKAKLRSQWLQFASIGFHMRSK